MAKPLKPATIEIVKATVPALEAHGFAIVKAMYARLFVNPEIRALFNQTHHASGDAQPKALAGAILAYARHIENPSVLAAAIERIAQKHVSLQILPEHYPFVAEALLGAIKEVLGEAATPEILEAWGEAYWLLADVLIGREKTIYDEAAVADGGWRGWREFTVVERVPESEVITSFILRPSDGGPVLRHRPGQYLAFDLDLGGQGVFRRNYSISSAPNADHYRISVKREAQGVASAWLHDRAQVGTKLRVAAPAGDFVLEEASARPIVLLSGGVGLTPMLSILGALPEEKRRAAFYVHAARSRRELAQAAEARALAGRSAIFLEEPAAADRLGVDYDAAGRITPEWLARETPVAEAEYYVCGPKGFMAMAIHGLLAAGVAPERLRYEFFGPAGDLEAAA